MVPENEAALAEAIAGADGPLAVRGGGTRGVDLPGEVLSTAGLSGVDLYEPSALTLVVGAGTPVAEIDALLAGENQRLAFEPMDHRGLLGTSGTPTIGGVIAGNISGSRRVQVGAARDFLLGVRFVDGRGQMLKNGGRVMKNVTGYDLVKLMAGSWGTLGVLSQVSLKVLPRAEAQATLVVGCADAAGAVGAMSAALGSPFDVSGAGFAPAEPGGENKALIRVEGFADSVSYRAGRLKELLAKHGDVDVVAADISGSIWANLRDVVPFQGREGDVWRISARPSQAAALVDRLGAEATLLDWGGGLIWALMAEGTDLRARAGAYDGHATLIRAGAETKARLGMFQPQPAAVEVLQAGLRDRFDPRGLFNPGLMQSPVEA